MKFKTKNKKVKHLNYGNKIYKTKFGVKSERGTSFNKITSKYNRTHGSRKSKQNKGKNSRVSIGHSISIESKVDRIQIYIDKYKYCNTLQVSAIKVPSRLISEK